MVSDALPMDVEVEEVEDVEVELAAAAASLFLLRSEAFLASSPASSSAAICFAPLPR
jgi:hypothetical protein